MSAISDYASLLLDAAEYSQRSNIAHVFPRYLGMAELKLNRALRVADMEVVGTVTITSGDGTLPADLLEVREFRSPTNIPLRAMSLQQLTNAYRDQSGTPRGYAVVGSTVKVRPTADGDCQVTYYGKIPALTPSNPTNWLLTKAPDVYLYAVVAEISIAAGDAAKTQGAMQLMSMALQGLQVDDERRRWGNSQMVVGGITP